LARIKQKPAKKLRTGVRSLAQYDLLGLSGEMNRQQRRKHERMIKKRLMKEIEK